jgi:NAD(P)-dependent dehydrogenase (short-subunit alcohol dehydrogenase family)
MGEISLKDQVAVVTGARRGLGRAYALELARCGAAIVANGRRGSDGLEELIAEIEREGGSAVSCLSDVDTRSGGKAVVDTALERFGRLDIVVNNAGILRTGYFEDLADREIDAIIDIHLKAAFYVTQAAFPVLRENGYGRVVNTSSNTAFGMAGLAHYAAAKAGVIGLTKSLALEGADDGILVNCVLPNATTPAMANDPVPGFEEDTRFMSAYSAVAGRYDADLVAPLVAYLASPACRLTGEAFSALGGRYARVFFGVTTGWFSPLDSAVSADDIARQIDEITRIEDGFLVPDKIRDEYEEVAALFGGDRAGG